MLRWFCPASAILRRNPTCCPEVYEWRRMIFLFPLDGAVGELRHLLEISARSPKMSDDEFRTSSPDIKERRNSFRYLDTWHRGNRRAQAVGGMKQLGIKPKIVNLDPEQDSGRLARALECAPRPHRTPSQRSYLRR